jgi:cardiolipin synthase
LWIRNHRKILIIDQSVAFIGGVNVDQVSTTWDDLHLEMEGPVVRSLTRAFAKSYIRSGGSREAVGHLLVHSNLFNLQRLKQKINLLIHTPKSLRAVSSLWYFYRFAMGRAEKTVTLLTPYYVPDKHFLRLISETRSRGVTVNILIPGRSDHRFMEYMAESFYAATAAAGANLFLLKNMNHGKALSVDGRLGFVGSVNITPRSFFLNEEAGVYFTDERMVQDLEKVLGIWQSSAERVVVAQNRKWYDRFLRPIVAWFKNYV